MAVQPKVLGKRRTRRGNAQQALVFLKQTLPNLKSLTAFNNAYATANERNAAQIALLEAYGHIFVHLMRELNEDETPD